MESLSFEQTFLGKKVAFYLKSSKKVASKTTYMMPELILVALKAHWVRPPSRAV